MGGRQVVRWELAGVDGPVVVIDVIRAFTTAAYAFDAGADAIYLVASLEEALAFKADHPDVLLVGEDHGLRPEGFDYPNSPAVVSRADLGGRTMVQRTSAGTQGVVAAVDATRLWAASLACASATARAVEESGLGEPSYVITGSFPDAADDAGDDDRLTADVIERVRTGRSIDPARVREQLLDTRQAERVQLLGPEHFDPIDLELAAQVDRFDFAMEVTADPYGRRLEARAVGHADR